MSEFVSERERVEKREYSHMLRVQLGLYAYTFSVKNGAHVHQTTETFNGIQRIHAFTISHQNQTATMFQSEFLFHDIES